MKKLACHFASLSITAWVGSLWVIGYLAVPVLFHAQPDRQLAGRLAGEMFAWSGYLGLICGMYLLAYYFAQSGRAACRQAEFRLVLCMYLILLIFMFYFQPTMNELKHQALPLEVMNSIYASQFRLLHGLSSIAYLVESLLGAALVIKSR